MDLAGRTSLTHVRRRRVGRCEAMRGEDNVRRVLTRHILVVARFSVYTGRQIYWNMNTVRIEKISQFSIFIITILQYVRNYTPAKRMFSIFITTIIQYVRNYTSTKIHVISVEICFYDVQRCKRS